MEASPCSVISSVAICVMVLVAAAASSASAQGIEPFVTIYHFNTPQALQVKYGGYLNHKQDFQDYSDLCFKLVGDRVKHWFTINEPSSLAVYSYEIGIAPPGRFSLPEGQCGLGAPPPGTYIVLAGPCFGGNSSTEPYIAAHNLILAHAAVEEQKGEVGIVLTATYFAPFSKSQEDKAAAKRLFDFTLGWFMEPLVFGNYPQSMRVLNHNLVLAQKELIQAYRKLMKCARNF